MITAFFSNFVWFPVTVRHDVFFQGLLAHFDCHGI